MCMFGHKFGKVEADGFQYCQKCGKAKKVECNHIWETDDKLDILNQYGRKVRMIYVLKCKKCGEVQEKTVASVNR